MSDNPKDRLCKKLVRGLSRIVQLIIAWQAHRKAQCGLKYKESWFFGHLTFFSGNDTVSETKSR